MEDLRGYGGLQSQRAVALDSNCFYVLEKSGAMAMPCRDDDGLVHIQRKVVVARGFQLENLLELLGPLLREREGKLTILVCPSVRFLKACCHAHDSLSQEPGKLKVKGS
jgi:hypothetical protein